jgi:hypothetical protein
MIRKARRSIACSLVLVALLVSCGDDSTTAPPPQEPNVVVESGNAASQSIGVEGGTLSATANDGTVYTLEIPEGSIPIVQTITMTPIVDIDGYPLADGVAAGVDLKPAGLVFAVPATLTIESAKTPGAGLLPAAITYEGDATSFAPTLVGDNSGTFTIPLEHFSGGTVGFATAQELESLVASQGAPCLQPAIGALPEDVPTAVATYHSCFASDVLPALEQAANDRELAAAIGKYNMWKVDSRDALNMPPFDDASETQQAMNALVPKLQEAIIRNNDRCEQQQSFASAANVLFWQQQAARFDLDTVGNLLDLNTVLSNLCLRVVVDTAQLPANMQVGFPHSLDIQFGVIFGGQASSQGAPFAVDLTGDGITLQDISGFTNSQGQYTTVATATRDANVSVTAHGCLILPGTTTPTDICITQQISSTGQNLTGTWCGTATFSNDPDHTIFNVTMTLTQNQNAISGTYTQEGARPVPLSATLSGTALLNVSMEFSTSTIFAGTGTVAGDTITIHVSCCPNRPESWDIVVTRGPGCP